MARPYGGLNKTRGAFTPQSQPPWQVPQMVPLVSSKLSKGINTVIDPTDIEMENVTDALNVRIRFDKLSRRRGTELFGATAPDAFPVTQLYSYKNETGVGTFLRFTYDGIYRDPDTWTPITGTLTGTADNRFNVVTAFNQVVFTNGVDEIQVIDLTGDTFAQLGNADVYKYITVFDNRVVAANYAKAGSENPIQIAWSGDANITEWDPASDISAGSSTVEDSPGDNADFITGIFGFTNIIILLRERSLWVGTKQPIASFPFNFYADVPGIGCGCPYSAAVIPGGLVFADHRTRKVYVYTPGQQPTAISLNIELDLFNAIQDPMGVFGSYDNANNEYSLAVPDSTTGIVRIWIFNFRTQAWSYDERVGLTCMSDQEGSTTALTIDDLTGNIDDLVGTIADLVGTASNYPSRLYGFNDGIIQISKNIDDDDSGDTFTSRVQSKTYVLPVTDQYVCQVQTEFLCRQASTIKLYYSKDSGITWTLARTDTINKIGQPVLLTFNKQIKCRKFTFKLESTIGDWDLLNYGINVYRSGPSRATIP